MICLDVATICSCSVFLQRVHHDSYTMSSVHTGQALQSAGINSVVTLSVHVKQTIVGDCTSFIYTHREYSTAYRDCMSLTCPALYSLH